MLYREITTVCSQIHTKHMNTLCGQNVELLNVKLAVHLDSVTKTHWIVGLMLIGQSGKETPHTSKIPEKCTENG